MFWNISLLTYEQGVGFYYLGTYLSFDNYSNQEKVDQSFGFKGSFTEVLLNCKDSVGLSKNTVSKI